VLCLRDITDRREAERQLRESELRYRLLVDHAPEAILVMDMDAGRYIDANANAERLFGMDSKRLLRLNPLDLSPKFQTNGDVSAERIRVNTSAVLAGRDAGLRMGLSDRTG
jgi:two-component system sensor histidine kinase/response regulator